MRRLALQWLWIGVSGAFLALAACHDDNPDPGPTPDGGVTEDCASAATNTEQVVCASNAFLATLTEPQKSSVLYPWTDQVAKTSWSNLPGVTRNGLTWGSLSADSKAAALKLASLVLSSEGYEDMTGIFAADDYLNSLGGGGGGGPPPGGDGGMGPPPGGDGGMGGGGPGLAYGAANYIIAFIGTPSATGSWMLQIGGHHMAFNVTYLNGTAHPTPNHLGAEPKSSFTWDGGTYAPLEDDGAALAAVYSSMDATQLASAYLAGQMYSDVLLGPVEYRTGSYDKVVFPAQVGVLVSSLSASQKELVTTAIRKWVGNFAPAISDPLMATYTSADAYAHTYVSWAGSEASGPNVDVEGTYMRVDGPRLWLEVACQGRVVIRGITHYHTIYRDKLTDYGDELKQ